MVTRPACGRHPPLPTPPPPAQARGGVGGGGWWGDRLVGVSEMYHLYNILSDEFKPKA